MPEIVPITNGGAFSRWVESTPPEETLLTLNENGQVVASNAVMQAALLAWLPALPRSMPAEPNKAWIDGDIVKVSAAWVMTGGVWDDSGSWVDSQIWSDN